LFETGKKLAIAQALISTYVGFTKALEQGGVLGLVTGATVLASGMAKVAAIRATKMGGGGGGGGGAGGGGISRAAFSAFDPFQNREQFMAGGLGAQFAPARQATTPYEFRIRGRDLVAAVDETRSANTRRGIG